MVDWVLLSFFSLPGSNPVAPPCSSSARCWRGALQRERGEVPLSANTFLLLPLRRRHGRPSVLPSRAQPFVTVRSPIPPSAAVSSFLSFIVRDPHSFVRSRFLVRYAWKWQPAAAIGPPSSSSTSRLTHARRRSQGAYFI